MAVIERVVTLRISASNAEHYEKLGYERGDVVVNVTDLPRGSKIKVTMVCDNCGKITADTPHCNVLRDRIYGNDLCRRCLYDINVIIDHSQKESYGESVVRRWLTNNGVKYATQVRRKGLTGICGRPLMFDFAIIGDDGNPNMYVEYDGEQHYKPVDFAGNGEQDAKVKFAYQQEFDRRKDRYCRANGVPLLRIKYDLNVEEIGQLLKEAIGL